MNSLKSVLFKERNPQSTEIHVHQKHHAAGRGISISSTRQAAQAKSLPKVFLFKIRVRAEDICIGIAEATNPTSIPTVTRMPRMQGFPANISGFE